MHVDLVSANGREKIQKTIQPTQLVKKDDDDMMMMMVDDEGRSDEMG